MQRQVERAPQQEVRLEQMDYKEGGPKEGGPIRVSKITTAKLRAMLEKQGYRCALTDRELTPKVASVDHMMPVSRGGPNTIDNICILHSDVNRAKGTQTVGEFIQMCREVVEMANREAGDDNA